MNGGPEAVETKWPNGPRFVVRQDGPHRWQIRDVAYNYETIRSYGTNKQVHQPAHIRAKLECRRLNKKYERWLAEQVFV